MKIVYVANHDQPNADDEGAIYHVLTDLGHEVTRIREFKGYTARRIPCDFVLFHKWVDYAAIRDLKLAGKRLAFWYFDLVDYPDPEIAERCARRREWMRQVLPWVDVGFCTDGDWVKTNPKLVWLPQGADERVVGGSPAEVQDIDLLFVGTENGGEGRSSFVAEMRATYGKRFVHFPRGVYGRALADLVSRSKIVLCPDHPATDNYWSNRVYVMLGFGAFLLHPYCERLADQYRLGEMFYRGREDLHRAIDRALQDSDYRLMLSREAHRLTIKSHLYRHRVIELLDVVGGL